MKRLTALAAAALIALVGTAAAQEKKAPAPAPAKKEAAAPAAAEKKAPDLMDINTATEKELSTLKGVGDARAKAIVKGRPYKGKNELLDKKIVPENVYNDIKDLIIAHQKAEKPADKPANK